MSLAEFLKQQSYNMRSTQQISKASLVVVVVAVVVAVECGGLCRLHFYQALLPALVRDECRKQW